MCPKRVYDDISETYYLLKSYVWLYVSDANLMQNGLSVLRDSFCQYSDIRQRYN